MKLPNKCGNVYIKFDDDNNPEYGFVVDEKSRTKSIINFLIMTNKKIDTIVLPNLVPNSIISAEELKKGSDELANYDSFGRYVLGEVKICKNCFKGIKKAKIVIPFNGSIMVDWGSFDDNAQIEFVTDKNLALKHVYRMFDTVVGYEHENWVLIADKSLKFDGSLNGDKYSIEAYHNVNINHKPTFLSLTNCGNENEQNSVVL